jgi:hypothetical protein
MRVSLALACVLAATTALGQAVSPREAAVSNATQAISMMAASTNPASLRAARASLNASALTLAVMDARRNGQPTVGVVVPAYKAVIDAENTGSNFVASVAALGIAIPFDWGARAILASDVANRVLSDPEYALSPEDMARIEMYLGVEGFNAFRKRYNEL